MPNDPPSADEWHRQAHRDLQAAEHLLTGDFPAHAAVLAHLAVEKAMKACLRAETGATPPVTHDLHVLADRLIPGRGTDGWTADHQDALDVLAGTGILALYAPDRPFGPAVSDRADAARERVAAARTLVAWLDRHR